MEEDSKGRTTVHTRLRLDEETTRLLDDYARRFGRDLRRLHALLDKGVSLTQAKNEFVREGLTARQFNGIAAKLRGMKESRDSSYQLEIQSKGRRARAIEKKLVLEAFRGGYSPRVRHQKTRVLRRLQDILQHAPHRKPRLIFGGQNLWQAQHHLKENGFATHDEWRNAWRAARSGEFFFVGSKDESQGNQSVARLPGGMPGANPWEHCSPRVHGINFHGFRNGRKGFDNDSPVMHSLCRRRGVRGTRV